MNMLHKAHLYSKLFLQLGALKRIYENASKNNVRGVQYLTKDAIRRLEPHLSSRVLGGLYTPDDLVVDSCLVPVTLAHHARRHGAQVTLLVTFRLISCYDYSLFKISHVLCAKKTGLVFQ